MEPVHYTLDPSRSRVTIRTEAEGLFSPLAHDLEIEAVPTRGEATDAGSEWSATVVTTPAALRVVGAVKRGAVDPGALSARDRSEIERRIREEVLRDVREVVCEASGRGASAEVIVRASGAGARFPLRYERLASATRDVAVEGSFELSLRALGVPEVRGPLGAFRVRDRVRVSFRLTFTPAASEPSRR